MTSSLIPIPIPNPNSKLSSLAICTFKWYAATLVHSGLQSAVTSVLRPICTSTSVVGHVGRQIGPKDQSVRFSTSIIDIDLSLQSLITSVFLQVRIDQRPYRRTKDRSGCNSFKYVVSGAKRQRECLDHCCTQRIAK